MLDTTKLRRAIVTTAILAATTAPAAAARPDATASPGHGRDAVVVHGHAPRAAIPPRVESMGAYNPPVTRTTSVPAEPVLTTTDHTRLPWAAVALAGLALTGLVLVAAGVAILRRRPPALPGTPQSR